MIRVRDGKTETLLTIEEFERRARRGELSPHVWVCLPAMTGDRFVRARELSLFAAIYDPRRFHFRHHFHIGRLPLLTILVSAICILMYAWSVQLGDGAATSEALLTLGAKATARLIEDGELWRLFTANFLHRNLIHLGFNLFAFVCIGTVLEGVYRRGDVLLLIVFSGVCTMGLSALLTDPVTVGASGIVFGCLGCAVVFGWRYADILAWRYRVVFGVVIVGYAAVMFYLGLNSPTTDNWGHGGGLLAGFLMGGVLSPRLLRFQSAREPWRTIAAPYVLAAGLPLLLVVLGPAFEKATFRWADYDASAFGVRIWRPAHWRKVSEPLGLTFQNGADAFASLSCTRRADEKGVDDAVARYQKDVLFSLSYAGHIGSLEVGASETTTVRGVDARRLPFTYLASDGPRTAQAVLFVRGELECALVLAHRPMASASTRARLDEIRERLELTETVAQRTARVQAAAHGTPQAWLELALAHKTVGAVDEAREAFRKAQDALVESPHQRRLVHYARARFELAVGGDVELAWRAVKAADPAPIDLDGHLLWAEAAWRTGRLDRAAFILDKARALAPHDERVQALAARVGAPPP